MLICDKCGRESHANTAGWQCRADRCGPPVTSCDGIMEPEKVVSLRRDLANATGRATDAIQLAEHYRQACRRAFGVLQLSSKADGCANKAAEVLDAAMCGEPVRTDGKIHVCPRCGHSGIIWDARCRYYLCRAPGCSASFTAPQLAALAGDSPDPWTYVTDDDASLPPSVIEPIVARRTGTDDWLAVSCDGRYWVSLETGHLWGRQQFDAWRRVEPPNKKETPNAL